MAEFKIGRLRYTWKGNWQTGEFYNRDAVVAFNGKTYVCLVPHTAGDFYEDAEYTDPVTGFTPYWTIMLEGIQWKGNWTPATSYTLGNIVLYTGSLYICTVNHTSGTSINLSNWDIYVTVNSTWSGAYEGNRVYRIGETVKYGGIVYKCIEEHTTTATIDETKWEVLNIGIEYRSDWGPSILYRKNDIVKFGANLWIATEEHFSGLEFVETSWDLWLPGLEYGTSWISTTTYQIGDVVKYGGYSYVSKVSNNLNIIPSTNSQDSSDAWELLTTGYDVAGVWNDTISYKIGSVVRYSGNVFVAKLDSTGQNPTTVNLSKTYVSAGSSGTTVKLNSTTGLVVGMIISGSGFDRGQFISKIVDNTTIEVSQPPYTTIINGTSLSFNGINGEFWELIISGTRWRNRWNIGTNYITGDVSVWKNATYYCIKTHSSDNVNRPDVDTTRTYWILYFNHDQYNVLNQPGDIIVNTDGVNEALPIGSEGFLLKSVAGIPTWSNVFQTPAVYYVAPKGTDEITSGDTWDNPYRTIRYACEQIALGLSNFNFKTQLDINFESVLDSVEAWVTSQVTLSTPPFLNGIEIDIEKTRRDTSYLLDAIGYDLTRGGNSQTIAFAYSFFDREYSNQFINSEVEERIPQFIATISYTFSTLLTVITPNTQLLIDLQSLENIIITALTNGNTSSLPPENQGLTATLMVKTGTYEETLPIVVPANTALVGDELRGVVVKPKLVINTVAIRTQASNNLITVKSTEGMIEGTPVQFVSINPISKTNTVFGGLESGRTYYVKGETVTNTTFSVSETLGGSAVTLTNFVSQMYVYGGDALSDMFYVQNGTGIRNMTLTGLLGTLTDLNPFETRRPTGGAYVSLDPGLGPEDTSSWIYRKSPYIQNVTTFGVGATGLKIDGNLHEGGNKSIVCNDFTQIISDGIGVWCTGPDALCEAVSVFSYYAYAGYFSENGGRIRATNGNSSYGTFGVVAEGFNAQETPITGTVDNRYFEATATPLSSLGANAEILKLQYSHAGENYFSETTNLLKHSNLFTNWNTDSNVTLIQSITSPIGQSNGWLATGNTSGTDSSYFYQDVEIAPSGATYTALSGDIQTGNGVGATFDVIVTSTQYLVTVNNGGSGYVTTNQIQINGSRLGGLDGANDLIITVTSLSGTSISTISIQGTVQVGSIQPYVVSIFCKKGTSTEFDVTATFSGYSTVTSGVTFNFNTKQITAISATGGALPETFAATPISGQDGWFRLSFVCHDITALNNNLQIRVYPRGRFGNSGSTALYGGQLEVGNTLGFYLETTTEEFSAHANFDVFGAGSGVYLIGDEIRSDSVFQTRILEVNGNTGGAGYILSTNNAQFGDAVSISISGSDVAGEKDYLGMRIFINSGLGAGQYGVISSFDVITKVANVLRESFSPVTIVSSESATNTFTLTPSEDINTLYINQPVQFVPTNYVIEITNVSQNSLNVTGTIGGTINTVSVESTARLAVDMPITFSGVPFGGISIDFTYYVLTIIDETTIQISTSIGGSAVLLNNSTQTATLNYPSNTSFIVGDTENMQVNLPIYFTGEVFSNIVPGQTYYINEVYDDTQFTISSSLAIVTATSAAAATDYITVNDTASLRSINPIVFSGTSFGGITANTKYYINHVVDLSRITVTSSVVDTIATSSLDSSNLITVESTAGFIIGNPVIITGTTFGGVINDRVYYVHYVANDTLFSISNTSTPLSIAATQTSASTNIITVDNTNNLMPLNPIKFFGTTFGNIVAGTEYFVNRIISPTTFSVSASIISVNISATEVTSNLITTTSTAGFVADNPIIFGGASIGGIVSGTVYYISAVNDAVSFTISSTPGGSAVTLTSATGTMTARTPSSSFTLSNATGTMTGISRFTGSAVNLTTGVGECHVRTTGPSITLTSSSGSLTGTSTVIKEILTAATGSMNATYSVPLIGGISGNTTYYVKAIVSELTKTFTISETQGGPTVSLTNSTGSMRMGELGWDHVNPGTPLAGIFDSTTVYSIEPLITYSKPEFIISNNTNAVLQPPSTSYNSITYGSEKFVAVPGTGITLSVTEDGITWIQQQLPSSASWTDIAYGNNYWVIISSGDSGLPGSKVLYSNSDLITWKVSNLPSVGNWSKVVYGNGKFVAIGGGSSAVSNNSGTTWTAGTINADTWVGLAYGSGRFVAISPTNSKAAYSINGTSWTVVPLPSVTTWSSIEFGNGRFVAISSTSGLSAYSFDGATWYESRYPVQGNHISYGNGLFLATSNTGTTGYISEDGIVWFRRSITESTGITTFGFDDSNKGLFVGISGQNSVSIVRAGSQTKARPQIFQDKIVGINEWDPGSNYSAPPTVSIFDSNATRPVVVQPALGDGVLGNPTFYNRGTGYNTASTLIFISGDGYAENFQVGLQIIFENLQRLPSPGDNLIFDGDDTVYKVTEAEALDGTVAPNVRGLVGISPSMSTALSPAHGTTVTIRTKYSQVRLTNHDFLNIGYGNFEESNYPLLPEETLLSPENETIESNFGRVFYSSTDQDGNFRVGKLFAVEQATGIVTLSASQFGLDGLSELRLGGIAVGGNSVVITQFSTDSTFVANSNTVIPTQRAIKAHLAARLSQGGANTFTGQLIAGTVLIGGPDRIASTIPEGNPGSRVNMPVKVNVRGFENGGWDGDGMAFAFFMKHVAIR